MAVLRRILGGMFVFLLWNARFPQEESERSKGWKMFEMLVYEWVLRWTEGSIVKYNSEVKNIKVSLAWCRFWFP